MLLPTVYRASYMGIQFVTGIVIANALLPSSWGDLSLFILNAAIISLITGFGADSIVIHSLTNNKWKVSQALYFLWRITALQLILFFLVEIVFFKWLGTGLLSQNKESDMLLELLYFSGLILTEKYTGLFYSTNSPQYANKFLLIQALMFLIAFAVIGKFAEISFKTALIFVCFQTFVQGSFLCILFHFRVHRWSFIKIKWEVFWTFFKLSSVVMLTNCIQFVAYRIDFYLLEKFHSTYEVGIYAQANKFANLIWVVPNIFALLIMIRFKEIKKEELPVFFRLAVFVNIVITAITVIATNTIYAYWLHADYKSGLKSFYLMLPGYFFFSLVIYLAAYVSWMGKFQLNLIGSSLCLFVIFFSDLLFIPGLSFNGAALSNTIAYSLTFLFYIVVLFGRSSYSIRNFLLPKRTDLFFLLKLIK